MRDSPAHTGCGMAMGAALLYRMAGWAAEFFAPGGVNQPRPMVPIFFSFLCAPTAAAIIRTCGKDGHPVLWAACWASCMLRWSGRWLVVDVGRAQSYGMAGECFARRGT